MPDQSGKLPPSLTNEMERLSGLLRETGQLLPSGGSLRESLSEEPPGLTQRIEDYYRDPDRPSVKPVDLRGGYVAVRFEMPVYRLDLSPDAACKFAEELLKSVGELTGENFQIRSVS